MNKLIIIPLVLMFSCSKDKLTPSSNIYNPSIVMLGDSQIKQIQGGFSGIPYSWSDLLNVDNVKNEGYNGYTMRDLYESHPLQNTLGFKPDKVFLMAGTNDCLNDGWQGVETCKETVLYLDSICDKITSQGADVCFILPVPFTFEADSILNTGGILNDRIELISQHLSDYCIEYNVEFVDFKGELCYNNAEIDKWFLCDSFSIDGIHFNLDGYRAIRHVILNSIGVN